MKQPVANPPNVPSSDGAKKGLPKSDGSPRS